MLVLSRPHVVDNRLTPQWPVYGPSQFWTAWAPTIGLPTASCNSVTTPVVGSSATSAKITRSILENCGDIIHALVTGAAAEPELEVALAGGHRRHIAGAGMIVGLLRNLDALDESVDPDAAVDTLAALSDFRLALLLRDSYGWSLDRIETWIAATSQTLLLRSPQSA